MESGTVPKPYIVTDEPRDFPDSNLVFLATYTGCSDYAKLRARVIELWREVKSKLWVYKCIQEFMFLIPRIAEHPVSAEVVKDYKATVVGGPGDGFPFLLEVGSCFGTDLRWLVQQGVKPRSLIATDLTRDYWDFGYKLYNDEDTLDVQSYFGSMTDDAFISATTADTPLGPFRGRVHYVWAGAVLHVLSEEGVLTLLQNVFLLLRSGGTFFGTCVGSQTAGAWFPTPDGQALRYLHSQASLKETLQRVGFTDVSVSQAKRVAPQDVLADVQGSASGARVSMLAFAAQKK